jgi:hypothetical protein
MDPHWFALLFPDPFWYADPDPGAKIHKLINKTDFQPFCDIEDKKVIRSLKRV